jgi:hypothetical protein
MNSPSRADVSSVSVLEQFEWAFDLVAGVLHQAPQLHQTRLDQALLVLSLSLERARRSPALRPLPQWRQPDLDF